MFDFNHCLKIFILIEIVIGSKLFAGNLSNADLLAGAWINGWSQREIINSEFPFDLAINGRGFFILRSSFGQIEFTRDGHFGLNKNKELVNVTSGKSVLGICPGNKELSPLTAEKMFGDLIYQVVQVRFDSDGVINLIYWDGMTATTCYLPLALIFNPRVLVPVAKNVYTLPKEYRDLWLPGKAKTGGRGVIFPYQLELLE